jgi:ketosteroid isomerase-like protein
VPGDRPTPNEAVVREGLAAFARGDVQRVLELVHPDVVSVRSAPLPDPQAYQGIDGLYQMYADWTADFGEFEMDTGEVVNVGDRVVVEVPQSGKGKASGAPVHASFWFVFTLADGKVARQEVFVSSEQALEAAGSGPNRTAFKPLD